MELTIVCIPPNGFELTKIPRILGAKSHVFLWGAAGDFPIASFSTHSIIQLCYQIAPHPRVPAEPVEASVPASG